MKNKHDNLNVNGYFLGRITAPKMVGYMNFLNAHIDRYYGFLTDIYDAYKNPSIYKIRAWRYCQAMCDAYNGYNLRITSFNCQSFSVAFEFIHPIDGNVCVAWITKNYNRYCDKLSY